MILFFTHLPKLPGYQNSLEKFVIAMIQIISLPHAQVTRPNLIECIVIGNMCSSYVFMTYVTFKDRTKYTFSVIRN